MTRARDFADVISGQYGLPTGALADDAVTSAKIADDAVVSAAIADDAVVSAAIADDAVVSASIADDAITSALIADDAVTDAKINASLGKVLNIEHATFSNLNESTSSSTFQDSSLTDSITPSSTSSKVLGFISFTSFVDAYQNQGPNGQFRVLRGTTEITRRDFSSWTDNDRTATTITFVDSPSTTSATTYKLQYRRKDAYAGGSVAVRCNLDSTSDAEIILLEIGG